MAKPTPDGRDWLTSNTIASRLGNSIINDDRVPQQVKDYLIANQATVEDILQTAFEDTGYTVEFKILRLTEKLKDSILAGNFGPLDDDSGRTSAGQIYDAFKNIYTASVLENYDENGNLIDG